MKIKTVNTPKTLLKTAETLSDALPHIRQFAGKTFVIKYGGHAMGEEKLLEDFAEDIVLLKHVGINPIVVHGGGPQIGAMLNRLAIKSEFVHGLRVTDRETVEIVEMVLAGSINKQIVSAINDAGGLAIGLSGKDGHLIEAKKLSRKVKDPESNIEKVLDLGFVGEPVRVNRKVLDEFEDSRIIPVIAPTGYGKNGETYNINADTAAGAIAAALKAEKLIMLTDVPGLLNAKKELISDLDVKECRRLMKQGVITGGMIPKIETCVDAVESGVKASHILDGRVPHVLLVETFTSRGAGTMITE
jgi:acetylglutamate kinase